MNYIIKEYPQDEFYFDFIFNPKNSKKKWWELVKEYGLYGIINLGYFNMNSYTLDNNTKYKGSWLYGPSYGDHGIGIGKDGKLSLAFNNIKIEGSKVLPNDDLYTYTAGCPIVILDGKDQKRINAGKNGNTMIGFKADGTPVMLLCSKDEGQTSAEGARILQDAGCIHIIRMDGSWSSQGQLEPGVICQPSENRYDYYYLGIFKKGWKPDFRKKVFLDPFEDCSSTNTPRLYRFMQKLQQILLEQKIECVFAKPDGGVAGGDKKALSCNLWSADLCISCYTSSNMNASVSITTSSSGVDLQKNILASYLEHDFNKCDYSTIRKYNKYTILTKTNCPTDLLTFNSNLTDVDMDDLAELTAEAIVTKYFGLDWIQKEIPKPEPDIPTVEEPIPDIKPEQPSTEITVEDYEAFKRVKNLGLVPENINIGDSINVPVIDLTRIIDSAINALNSKKVEL